jgi:hypothetical protein
MATQKVSLEYERDTKRMVRYKAEGLGTLYVPKEWFDGEPPKTINATFSW